MQKQTFRWAIVDIETTGLHVLCDRITEIAVTVMTETGIEQTWHSLINPGRSIPEPIMRLTGITNEMVKSAPRFEQIACELMAVLEDCVLVAHNARFDYGFLKNAFKACQITLQLPLLCTIKLFRHLYPDLKKFHLSALAAAFGITVTDSHRAEADVSILHTLLCRAFDECSDVCVLNAARLCYRRASLPSTLKTDVNAFPDSPGVYLFYGTNKALPLYIGKSVTLRQRILSHFQADHVHAKEFTMPQQVEHVEIIPTAGELSALLLESALIKERLPIFNRRLRRKKQVTGFRLVKKEGYLRILMAREAADEEGACSGFYGSFSSMTAAKRILLGIVKDFRLCMKLCGLEQSTSACFSWQLKKCSGACIGEERVDDYNKRVLNGLQKYRKESWPFKGAIAIREQDETNQLAQLLVFHDWHYFGAFENETKIKSDELKPPEHDSDVYKILASFLKNKADKSNLVELAWMPF